METLITLAIIGIVIYRFRLPKMNNRVVIPIKETVKLTWYQEEQQYNEWLKKKLTSKNFAQ
jgi:hypothetical protein